MGLRPKAVQTGTVKQLFTTLIRAKITTEHKRVATHGHRVCDVPSIPPFACSLETAACSLRRRLSGHVRMSFEVRRGVTQSEVMDDHGTILPCKEPEQPNLPCVPYRSRF
jgi:hypothetical protein